MAHPYFSLETVLADIPRLDPTEDTDDVQRFGEEADDQIDNLLPSPPITVPLDTVPDIISIASNKITKGKVYLWFGEKKKGDEMIAAGVQDVMNYITTYRQSNPTITASGIVTINDTDNTQLFENSPLYYED